MRSILRNITLNISLLKCMFYFLLDNQHLFSFFMFDTSPGHIFSKKGHFPSHSNRISSLTTLVLGAPLRLITRLCSCRFSSWVPILYSCFYGPPWDLSMWQHHRVALVSSIQVESSSHSWSLSRVPLYPDIALHPSLPGLSLVSHLMTFSPTVPYPLWYCVSH